MLIGTGAENDHYKKNVLICKNIDRDHLDMMQNIEPSTSEFVMSVDIVGCPAKKALYNPEEEVIHNRRHQGHPHHGYQCAKHR